MLKQKNDYHQEEDLCSAAKEVAVELKERGAANTTVWRQVVVDSLPEPQGDGEQSCVVMPHAHASVTDTDFRVRVMRTQGKARYWCMYSISVLQGFQRA